MAIDSLKREKFIVFCIDYFLKLFIFLQKDFVFQFELTKVTTKGQFFHEIARGMTHMAVWVPA